MWCPQMLVSYNTDWILASWENSVSSPPPALRDPQVTFLFISISSPPSPSPSSSHSCRMLINSIRDTSQSSPPWRPSTPHPRLAATGEARETKGALRTLEGLNPLTRNSCSHAGKESQTTAPSPHCSGSQMAPATSFRDTATEGRGLRPQSNLFLFSTFFKSWISDIGYTWNSPKKKVTKCYWAGVKWWTVLRVASIIRLWAITVNVTFITPQPSVAQSTMGRLWRGLHPRGPHDVQRAQRPDVTA